MSLRNVPNDPTSIAIHILKGGAGKTTIATNTARFLAKNKIKTLLVDADPQGNSSTALGQTDPIEYEYAIPEFFMGAAPEKIIQTTLDPYLDFIPNNLKSWHLPPEKKNPHKFRELKEIMRNYQITLVDCPPSADSEFLVYSGLSIADYVISPIDGRYAFKSIPILSAMLQSVIERENRPIHHLGFVVSKVVTNAQTSFDTEDRLLEEYGSENVFRSTMPQLEAFKKGEAIEGTIFDLKKDQSTKNAMDAVEKLTKEILLRIKEHSMREGE